MFESVSRLRVSAAVLLTVILRCSPGQQAGMAGPDVVGMQTAKNLAEAELQHTSSGTTVEPFSAPVAMWMGERAGWRLMLHGNGFITEMQQHASAAPTAPSPETCTALNLVCRASYRRGGDKLFSTNWIMPMAMRRLGPGQLTVRTMLDVEPGTITGREYPELFQQGETAYGKPIVDGQHPHDAVMELAALYDVRLGEHGLLSFYAAPVGDPAIGPTAYPHRLSASEDPIAALGHHQEDSTHIAFSVITAGLTLRWARLEASGFHGAEPDEAHWHFQSSPNGLAMDSYSGRLTVAPSKNLVAQYSVAEIASPEALYPGDNQRRQTASVMINRPVGTTHDTTSMPGMDMGAGPTGNWSTTLLWGQTRASGSGAGASGSRENSYLLESLLQFRSRNFAWTRIEVAGRSSELLGDLSAVGEDAPEVSLGHVQAYTAGYDREYRVARHVLAAPGAQFTVYRAPNALASTYGRMSFGVAAFVRFRVAGSQ
jgi:hypothetical protein